MSAAASEDKKQGTATPPKPALRKPEFTTIGELHPESRTVNLVCKVTDMQTVLEVKRTDGTEVKIMEATLADKTGSLILTCRTEGITKAFQG
jgi:ssDNA-binding replication factor A large subunit